MASTECRKFAPNIFNKSKCSACFRIKEDHSASAIEFNKASRKISKCGYLFVAPDWDFSNPINRTKRWQRRWFVLYDDGELTYSVDDHPETIPQVRRTGTPRRVRGQVRGLGGCGRVRPGCHVCAHGAGRRVESATCVCV